MNWMAFAYVIGGFIGVIAYGLVAFKLAFMASDAVHYVTKSEWLAVSAYFLTVTVLLFGLPIAIGIGMCAS